MIQGAEVSILNDITVPAARVVQRRVSGSRRSRQVRSSSSTTATTSASCVDRTSSGRARGGRRRRCTSPRPFGLRRPHRWRPSDTRRRIESPTYRHCYASRDSGVWPLRAQRSKSEMSRDVADMRLSASATEPSIRSATTPPSTRPGLAPRTRTMATVTIAVTTVLTMSYGGSGSALVPMWKPPSARFAERPVGGRIRDDR